MLARRLGEVVAGIHGLPLSRLPELRSMTAAKEIAELERDYRSFEWPRPVFELALCWPRQPYSGPAREMTLVHGDFRHGDLVIGPDGVRAVLDWELAHFGDPMEDLGWICVNSWRFGEIDGRSAVLARAKNYLQATNPPAAAPTLSVTLRR